MSLALARNPLQFGIYTAQHMRPWEQIRELWEAADSGPWSQAYLFDHFIPEVGGEDDACYEAWTLLAGLVGSTKRIEVGVLVTGNTYRNPAILAKQAVTVDHLSGGRLRLGMGTGWRELEHRAYGIPLPPPRELVDRLGEALEVIRLLETEARPSFDGTYYRLSEAPFAPRPVRGHMPVVIGAIGPRMLRHVARYADQWDTWGGPERVAANGTVVDRLATQLGRDPRNIRRSICPGAEPLRSEDAFRAHIERHLPAGVDTFIYNVGDEDDGLDLVVRAAPWIRAITDELAVATGA